MEPWAVNLRINLPLRVASRQHLLVKREADTNVVHALCLVRVVPPLFARRDTAT